MSHRSPLGHLARSSEFCSAWARGSEAGSWAGELCGKSPSLIGVPRSCPADLSYSSSRPVHRKYRLREQSASTIHWGAHPAGGAADAPSERRRPRPRGSDATDPTGPSNPFLSSFQTLLKMTNGGLPWRLSGKESACQFRRHGLHPWSWRIPHAAEQRRRCDATNSLRSRAQELQLLMLDHPGAQGLQQRPPE